MLLVLDRDLFRSIDGAKKDQPQNLIRLLIAYSR